MALTYSEAQAVSTEYFDKTITDLNYEKSPVFWTAKKNKKVKIDGGRTLRWPIKYRKLAQSGAVTPSDQIVYTEYETRTQAELSWKYYRSHTMIGWREQVENDGKARIVKLIADKTKELNDDMFDKFITDIYATTQGGLAFQSLDTIIDSSTTYAGIATADASLWAANEDTSTTRLTLYGDQSLAELINSSTFGTDRPTLISTTRDLQSKAESLLQGQQALFDKDLANAGFDNIKFKNIPIVGDYACPAGYMWGIDMNNLEFWVREGWDFKVSDWYPLPQAGFPDNLAKVVAWVGEVVCRQRQTNFKFTALDFTL